MKKTFLAMLLLGGSMSMFAQTQPAAPTQGNTNSTTNSSTATPQTTTGTTQQPTGTTGDPATQTGNNVSNMNNSAANGTLSNINVNTNSATTNNANWNGVSASTSWAPETAPSYGWNNYGVWQNSGSLYPTTTAGGFPIAVTADASANANGTAVSALPGNVQSRFNQDFPTAINNSYTWNQYGNWFHTYYMKDGRLWQYHYSQRGDGYALALPVIQTYVPENIINSALQKYGSNLYSIGMVKTNSGNSAYQIGLLQHGQLTSQYFDENGATVADVWRVEDSTSLNSTQSNAAMDNSSSSSINTDASNQSANSTDVNNQSSSDANDQSADKSKGKLKIKHADGSETKIKIKNGETKVKEKPAPNSTSNDQQ